MEKVGELTAQGLMKPAGLAAFARRSEDRSSIYAYENRLLARLDPEREQKFRAPRRPGSSSASSRRPTGSWPFTG